MKWHERGTRWRSSEVGWGGRQPAEAECGECGEVTALEEVEAWFVHEPAGSSCVLQCPECGATIVLAWGERAWVRRMRKRKGGSRRRLH